MRFGQKARWLRPPHSKLASRPLTPQVESDEVALKLTAELNRGKCGRVSFMPLNRLQPPEVKYPDQVRGALVCARATVCSGCDGALGVGAGDLPMW